VVTTIARQIGKSSGKISRNFWIRPELLKKIELEVNPI
jgi:hypothetical protein